MSKVAARKSDTQGIEIDRDDGPRAGVRKDRCPVSGA